MENDNDYRFVTAHLEGGFVNAHVKAVMRQTGINHPKKILQLVIDDDYIVIPNPNKWREKDGIIYAKLISSGRNERWWNEYCYANSGSNIGARELSEIKYIFDSGKIAFTNNVSYKIAIIKNNSDSISNFIQSEVDNHCWKLSPSEMAFVFLQSFSREEISAMGLSWIRVVHKPIIGGHNFPIYLHIVPKENSYCLSAVSTDLINKTNFSCGLMYLVSKEIIK